MTKSVITASELQTGRGCRQRWSISYVHRIRPARSGRALARGSLFHLGCREYYEMLRAAQAAAGTRPGIGTVAGWEWASSKALDVAINHVRAEAEGMRTALLMEEAEEHEAELDERERKAVAALELLAPLARPDYEEREIVAVEMRFKVPLLASTRASSALDLAGAIDVVLREWDGSAATVVDHKSIDGDASAYDLRLDTDQQFPGYAYALGRIFGPDTRVGDVVINVVRTQHPREPSINEDGTVSVAACDTTREQYEKMLHAVGKPLWWRAAKDAYQAELDVGPASTKTLVAWERARDRLEKIEAKQRRRAEQLPTSTARWASRHEHHYDENDLERWRREAHADGLLLRAAERGKVAITRNGGWCAAYGGCPYRTLCRWGDERYASVPDVELERLGYRRSASRHPELEDEEENNGSSEEDQGEATED